MKKINYKKLSIALIAGFAILRFMFALTHHLAGDACWHLSAARFIADENKIPLFEGLGRAQPFWPPPLFHLIAASFYKVFSLISYGLAEPSLKFVSPAFGTLSVIVMYLIARKLFDEKTAFYSLIFLNFFPLYMEFSAFSFVESVVTFFSILSIYLVINDRYILSSISLGLAALSKYNAAFIFPAVIYMGYMLTNRKSRLKKVLIMAIIPMAISSVWFIRNFILLKNPVWPFLNNLFHGIEIGTSFSTISLRPLISSAPYTNFYLEAFGIPSGNIQFIYSLNLPFMKFFLFAWIAGTLIFIYPLVKGFFKINLNSKTRHFIIGTYIALLSFLFMFVLYLTNVGWFVARLLLPIVPLLAIVWSIGLNSIKMKKIYLPIVLLVCLGFVAAEGTRIFVAANEWGKYAKDFEWARKNTNEDALFYGNGQCLSYNINREVFSSDEYISSAKVDYIWLNNNWNIDFKMDENSLKKVNMLDKKVVYNNIRTGTIIYKVR